MGRTSWHGWRAGVGWSGVVVLNLAVPLPLGLLATKLDGRIGLGLGVVLCWMAGWIVCVQSPRLAGVLIRGGGWVGLLQFIPILQIAAGLAGIVSCEALGGHAGLSLSKPGMPSILGGFLVTLATAVPLLLMAFVLGGGFGLLRDGPATEQKADYA